MNAVWGFVAGAAVACAGFGIAAVNAAARRRKATQAAVARLTNSTPPLSAEVTHTIPGTNVRVIPPGAGSCRGCGGEGWVDGDYSQVVCLSCHGSGDAA